VFAWKQQTKNNAKRRESVCVSEGIREKCEDIQKRM
jgi:hypothetical protein